MSFYNPINNAIASLTSAHVLGDGLLTVDNISVFGSPTPSLPIRVSVGNTIFSVTGVTGNSLNIAGVLEGTSDAPYPVGSVVANRITAGTITDIQNTVTGMPTTVSNSDGSLTASPTTGNVIISLNSAHANTWTGLQTFTASTATTKGLIVKGATTQSATLQEWQTSTGTILASVASTGAIAVNLPTGVGRGLTINGTVSGTQPINMATTDATSYYHVLVSNPNTQVNMGVSGSLAYIKGFNDFSVGTSNTRSPLYLTTAGLVGVRGTANGAITNPSGQLHIQPENGATKTLVVQAAPTKTATVNNVALTSNVATLTTSANHNFAVGTLAVITGLTNSQFNGSYTITSVPTSTTFTYALTGANVAATADTGTATVNQSADLQEWQSSTGTVVGSIDSNGGLNVPVHYGAITTDTDGATITFNLATSNWHQVQIAGNRTLAISNPKVGQQFAIILQQDSTGSRTVTWFSGILWVGGTAPTLTATANKRDVFTFKCISTGVYLGFVLGQNL